MARDTFVLRLFRKDNDYKRGLEEDRRRQEEQEEERRIKVTQYPVRIFLFLFIFTPPPLPVHAYVLKVPLLMRQISRPKKNKMTALLRWSDAERSGRAGCTTQKDECVYKALELPLS